MILRTCSGGKSYAYMSTSAHKLIKKGYQPASPCRQSLPCVSLHTASSASGSTSAIFAPAFLGACETQRPVPCPTVASLEAALASLEEAAWACRAVVEAFQVGSSLSMPWATSTEVFGSSFERRRAIPSPPGSGSRFHTRQSPDPYPWHPFALPLTFAQNSKRQVQPAPASNVSGRRRMIPEDYKSWHILLTYYVGGIRQRGQFQ